MNSFVAYLNRVPGRGIETGILDRQRCMPGNVLGEVQIVGGIAVSLLADKTDRTKRFSAGRKRQNHGGLHIEFSQQ